MTTQSQTFSDRVDFVQRAQAGDFLDDATERSMTRATVVEVNEDREQGRMLTVSELRTSYTGRPRYVYQTTRHTKFYSSDDPRWVTVNMNLGLAAGEPMASHLGPWLELDEEDQEDAVQRAAQWLTVLGHLHLCAQATSDDHPFAPVVAHEYISTLLSGILQGVDPF